MAGLPDGPLQAAAAFPQAAVAQTALFPDHQRGHRPVKPLLAPRFFAQLYDAAGGFGQCGNGRARSPGHAYDTQNPRQQPAYPVSGANPGKRLPRSAQHPSLGAARP